MAASFERNDANPVRHSNFFKLLSPESLIILPIPRRFVKQLDKSAPKIVTLCSPSGQFWRIQLLLNEDDELDVQFGRRWELFARAHGLKPGNVVLFHYEGNAVFSVKIFHSDGCCADDCNDLDAAPSSLAQDLTVNSDCCKRPTKIANDQRKEKSENTGVKAKVSQKRVRNKGELSRFEWILRSYNVDPARAQIYLPRGWVSTEKSEIISLDCLGKLWPVRLWVGLNERIAITTGWKQLVRETKLKEGDKCIFGTISQRVLGLEIERKT